MSPLLHIPSEDTATQRLLPGLRDRAGPWPLAEAIDLYNAADLHRTGLGRIEGGKYEPGLLTIAIIADALGVKLDELIAGLPVPKEHRPPPSRKRGREKPAGSE